VLPCSKLVHQRDRLVSMIIDAAFDGGNIEIEKADNPADIRLLLRKDTNAEFLQWFNFRLSGVAGEDCVISIGNAGKSSYTKGWEGYLAVASYDLETWFRVPTSYDGTSLTIRHQPLHDAVEYAYFAPYPHSRHRALIAAMQSQPGVGARMIGKTLQGRAMDLIEVGQGPLSFWFIARQHPGETQASWWMEGFLHRLCDPDDALARKLRGLGTFRVVPHMNPDGGVLGNLRTNAAGINLNRMWQEPSMAESPEVFCVREEMKRTGVDFLLDVHGDEGLPYNFIAGPSGITGLAPHVLELNDRFCAAFASANPDFQTEHGYPRVPDGRADLRICTKYVASTFDCLAMTLEQPFKDSAITPDPVNGWSPERCRKLGASALDALAVVVGDLRHG
jgi:murein tripeptide amidase MpaA